MNKGQEFYVVRAIDNKPVDQIQTGDFHDGREVLTTNNLALAQSCLKGSKTPQAIMVLVKVAGGYIELFSGTNLNVLNTIPIKKVKSKPPTRIKRGQRNYDVALKP